MTPRQQRVAAGYLTDEYRISQRHAARVLRRARSSLRYRPRQRSGEEALVKANLSTLPNNFQPNAAASMCTTGPDYAKFVLRAIQNPDLRKMQTRMKATQNDRLRRRERGVTPSIRARSRIEKRSCAVVGPAVVVAG